MLLGWRCAAGNPGLVWVRAVEGGTDSMPGISVPDGVRGGRGMVTSGGGSGVRILLRGPGVGLRLALDSDTALATRRKDGTVVVALWNYSAPDGTGASYTPPPATRSMKHFELTLQGMSKGAHVTMVRVDDAHGNVLTAYDAMGRPATPTRDQIAQLSAAGAASKVETETFHDGKLKVDVPEHGLVVMEIK